MKNTLNLVQLFFCIQWKLYLTWLISYVYTWVTEHFLHCLHTSHRAFPSLFTHYLIQVQVMAVKRWCRAPSIGVNAELCQCDDAPFDPRGWCVKVHRSVRLFIYHDGPIRHKSDAPFKIWLTKTAIFWCTVSGKWLTPDVNAPEMTDLVTVLFDAHRILTHLCISFMTDRFASLMVTSLPTVINKKEMTHPWRTFPRGQEVHHYIDSCIIH